VRALEDVGKRDEGHPIETPALPASLSSPVASGASLREALEGWKKERVRPEDGVHEYTRAVEMFIELHGNLAVADIKRSTAQAAALMRDLAARYPRPQAAKGKAYACTLKCGVSVATRTRPLRSTWCGDRRRHRYTSLSGTCAAGLFAGKGLCVQAEPLGGPAAAQDFSERPALNVVARTTMSAGIIAQT
jgi:hypothetical protein